MFPITRLFESDHAAREAVDKLVDKDVSRASITVISAYAPDAAASVDAAVERDDIMSGHRRALKEGLSKGRSIVTVLPEYGMGSLVERTLDSSGAVDTETLPDYIPSDPAPFSSMLGLPVLIDSKSTRDLLDFDGTSSFGFGLLSGKSTPLSSLFGLPLLSSKKGSRAKGSSVERMSGKAAPFSSMFGMKLLTSKKGSRAKGSSVERMSGNAAPLSRILGFKVLSKRK